LLCTLFCTVLLGTASGRNSVSLLRRDYGTQNTDRLSQDIRILKGTKHQLSVYDKIPIFSGFCKACVIFQFSLCSIRKGGLKNK
jgi:hypothetical protein